MFWQLQAPPALGFWIVMYRIWQASADLQDAQVSIQLRLHKCWLNFCGSPAWGV